MANGGPNDNGSQFFFTLGRCDELNKKNTIFGKVKAITLFFKNISFTMEPFLKDPPNKGHNTFDLSL